MTRRSVALGILGVSCGEGLLTLVAFRWLQTLGVPTVALLALLLAGMPLGALAWLRIPRLRGLDLSTAALVGAILGLFGALLFVAVSVASVDAHTLISLTDAESSDAVQRVLLRALLASSGLLPVFVGYGVAEMAAYRIGMQRFAERGAWVYALNLAGLLVAFVLNRLLLVPFGTSGVYAAGLLVLAATATALVPRRLPVLAGTLVLVPLAVFSVDVESFRAFQPSGGPSALQQDSASTVEILHDAWTPYCRLMVLGVDDAVFGYYDGELNWVHGRGKASSRAGTSRDSTLSTRFAAAMRPGDRVAVIGAGGGQEVAAALGAGAGYVAAVEIVPQVLELLAGELSDRVDGVYRDPNVELFPMSGRRYLRQTEEPLDFIVLASVESTVSGIRSLVEPSQFLYSREALRAMSDRLSPGGTLAIQVYSEFDRRGLLLAQLTPELEALDLSVTTLIDRDARPPASQITATHLLDGAAEFLVIAQRAGGRPASAPLIRAALDLPSVQQVQGQVPGLGRRLRPITDDRPFYASTLLTALPAYEIITRILVATVVILILLGVALIALLRSQGSARRGAPAAARAVGVSFVLIESLVVYRVMPLLAVPLEAVFLGMVLFIACAAAGGLLLERLNDKQLVAITAAVGLTTAATGFAGPVVAAIGATAAAVVTGTLFPRLLRNDDVALARVYSWDLYGTLWGALIALVLPLTVGFSGLQVAGAAALLVSAGFVRAARR